MGSDERQHAERMLYEYRRRLRYRERQKAKLGDVADPAIEADIDELLTNIAMLEPVVEPAPAPEVEQVIRRHIADDYLFIYTQVVKFGRRLTHVEAEQSKAAEWRETTGGTIDTLAQAVETEHSDRKWGQRRNFWISIVTLGVVMLVAILLLVVLR